VVVLLGVLAALAVTAATAAVREAARESSPLAGVAEGRRTVELVLELDADPTAVRGVGPSRAVVEATVTALEDGGTRTRLDDAVVLFGPADEWRGLLPGQVVRVRAAVAPAAAEKGVVARLSARAPPVPVGEPSAVQWVAGELREGLREAAVRVLGPQAGGLLPGLVVGDTQAMDPVLVEDFRRAGLAHLTAVSGANVAIVLAGVLAPLRRRVVDRRVQALVAVVALAGFVVLARPSASVVRAAAMGAVTLLALATGRSRAALPALGAAVVVLLLLDPGLARDAGFALSVAATAAIVLLAPGWSRRLRGRGWPPVLADAVAVAAAAGLATAPLVAGLSGLVSPVSLPANLFAAPAVAPATVLGLLAAVTVPVVPPLGEALVWLAGWPVRWLVVVAQRAAALPDGATGWPAGTRGAVLLTVLLLALGWLLWRFPRARRSSASCCSGGRCGRSPAGGRPSGRSSSPATSVRATRWWCRPRRGRACWWTPGPTSARSIAAWTGWASTRCPWCWSPTSTPTTSGAWPGRCPGGTSASSPPARSPRPRTGPPPWTRRRGGPAPSAPSWSPATGGRWGRRPSRCSPRRRRSPPPRCRPTTCRWWSG
jgi:competence protein ComEC